MFGAVGSWILNKINPDRVARLTRQQILQQYGQPDAIYQNKYCITWFLRQDFPWFPVSKIFINRDFMLKLSEAFTELEKEGLHTEIKTFDGCFVVRNTRGTNIPSLHSWGMAIDLNANDERLGQTTTRFSDRFIEIMTAHVYWGGQFVGRKDPMHFSLFGG